MQDTVRPASSHGSRTGFNRPSLTFRLALVVLRWQVRRPLRAVIRVRAVIAQEYPAVVVSAASLSGQKHFGSFYTPEPMAASLVDWAVRTADDTVLDPSFGGLV